MGSLYFGGMVGPVLSGHVTHYFGMSVTFWLCLLLNVLQILLVSAFFEESASPIDVTKQEEAVDVSFYELTIGPVVWLFSASSVLRLVGAIYVTQYTVFAGTYSVLILFVELARFHFSPEAVGWFIAANYLGKTVGVMLFLPAFLSRFSNPTTGASYALMIGVTIAMLSFIAYAVAPTEAVLFGVALVEGLDTVFDTCLNVIASLAVSPSEQGRAMGAMSFLRAILNLVAPMLGNVCWAATVTWYPAFTFCVLSGLSAISLALCVALRGALETSSADKANEAKAALIV